MRVLLIGSGGRENAIAWSVYDSPLLEKLYCIPGNPGIKEFAVCIDVNIKNYENDCKKIVQFIDEILTNVNSLDRVNEIKIDVNNYMRKFPMFKV